MKFFTPREKFKPVSLTGSWCALNCSFCGGRFLENMIHVDPGNFVDIAGELYSSGVRGLLLSGGFRRDGTLPIEPYIDKIHMVKARFNMVLSAHLGLVHSKLLLSQLRGCLDVIDYEFTLSEYIINEVRGLCLRPDTYVKSLATMIEEGLHVVPHVFVWHPKISLEKLSRELHMLEDMGVKEVTLLVYILPNPLEYTDHVVSKVVELVEHAWSRYSGNLYMGCMRPGRLKPIIDRILVERRLVDRIANPHYKVLAEYGNSAEVYDACCSLPEYLLESFRSWGLSKRLEHVNFKTHEARLFQMKRRSSSLD